MTGVNELFVQKWMRVDHARYRQMSPCLAERTQREQRTRCNFTQGRAQQSTGDAGQFNFRADLVNHARSQLAALARQRWGWPAPDSASARGAVAEQAAQQHECSTRSRSNQHRLEGLVLDVRSSRFAAMPGLGAQLV